ncbi:hypothetical protein E3T37_00660 [Cryobacterium sp. TMT2-10]|uniref:hypothetical protein n=1 Tax=Cryobacterium sp. TMT2-10 TaxID=1259244 RepID=UPI00106A9B42|nr:hypothetical protein [Cryobacterium sp. TMT2-10]TFD43810.1 hypothetical protein E3T37_00660 [Cryobacterium sp. TMT2-10]
MTDQHRADADDMSQIPTLIERIDQLLAADMDAEKADDTPEAAGMSAADAAYVDAKLLRILGLTSTDDDQHVSQDDLEWEHFILIATATLSPAPAETSRGESGPLSRRDVYLPDRDVVSAIIGGEYTSGEYPVLRLEQLDGTITAQIFRLPPIAPGVRVRLNFAGFAIYLRADGDRVFGSVAGILDDETFARASVDVSVAQE